jgi:hypothetical protein
MKYFKEAFRNHWNLLAFLSGGVFSLLTGRADIFMPLVVAGELAYVGLLGTHPRFREYVDAQEAKTAREVNSVSSQKTLAYILRMLPRDMLKKFDDLRLQCAELRQIAAELKTPGKATSDMPLENIQAAGLDRLLWIYLRMLYTQFSLARFLQKTNAKQIESDIEQIEGRIKQFSSEPNVSDMRLQRMQKTLEDNLQTSRDRLANLTKAKENFQLIQLEIERLENKIRSLSEVAVNRQEPDYISNEVDHVASSMMDTEKTMNDLQFATGLDSLDDQTPELLQVVQAQAVR